jgi:hypothetical protein
MKMMKLVELVRSHQPCLKSRNNCRHPNVLGVQYHLKRALKPLGKLFVAALEEHQPQLAVLLISAAVSNRQRRTIYRQIAIFN